jgi:hypothetical protein
VFTRSSLVRRCETCSTDRPSSLTIQISRQTVDHRFHSTIGRALPLLGLGRSIRLARSMRMFAAVQYQCASDRQQQRRQEIDDLQSSNDPANRRCRTQSVGCRCFVELAARIDTSERNDNGFGFVVSSSFQWGSIVDANLDHEFRYQRAESTTRCDIEFVDTSKFVDFQKKKSTSAFSRRLAALRPFTDVNIRLASCQIDFDVSIIDRIHSSLNACQVDVRQPARDELNVCRQADGCTRTRSSRFRRRRQVT